MDERDVAASVEAYAVRLRERHEAEDVRWHPIAVRVMEGREAYLSPERAEDLGRALLDLAAEARGDMVRVTCECGHVEDDETYGADRCRACGGSEIVRAYVPR